MLRSLRSPAFLAALLFPAALSAQAESLPAAKDLVARHVAAIGGREAIMKHTSMRATGTFSLPANGLGGELLTAQTSDGKAVLKVTIPGMGEMAGGYDGTIGWAVNPMQGPRLLEGKELVQMQEDAGFAASLLRESPSITGMETVEKSSLGGVECHKVKVTYASGRVTYDCYGTGNGMLAGQVFVQESPMGKMELVNLMSDWKEFGGIKVATTLRQQAMGQEQVMTITSVEFDSPEHAALFELPAAVKALATPKPASP